MRIAYFGYDFFAACLGALRQDGHEIISVHTFDTDNTWDFNDKILAHARDIGCSVHFDEPNDDTIERLRSQECDLIVSAAYPYKIPGCQADGTAKGIRGINLHPTLLPNGRGKWPLPWLILRHPEAAGLSIHKLTSEWDRGDILAQQRVHIGPLDDLETLSMKLQMVAPTILTDLLNGLDKAWMNATPAHERGSYWPMPTPEDRRLDWRLTVEEVLRIVRAFSKFETTAVVNETLYVVTRANGWVEPHVETIGSVVHESNKELVVAVSDGFVCLQEFSPVRHATEESAHRPHYLLSKTARSGRI